MGQSMKLMKLPVIRKKLGIKEAIHGVSFKELEPGDVLTVKGKKFIITKVAKFGEYVEAVPFTRLENFKKDELVGQLASQGGLGNSKPIEG